MCVRAAVQWSVVFPVLLIVGMRGAVSYGETAPPPLPNAMCPVLLEEAAAEDIWVESEGRKIHFCCKGCRKDFLKDPSAYLGNLEALASADQASEELGPVVPESAAPDEGEEDVLVAPPRLVVFAGKFHPVVVHFPTALVLGALAAEVLWLVSGKSMFSDAARFSIAFAAISAVAAVGLGWAAGSSATYPGDLARTLWLHRWVGSATGSLILITAVVSERARLRKGRFLFAYRALLLAASAGVGLTGHLGATLIYGPGYLAW